jgi:hypothetical protein
LYVCRFNANVYCIIIIISEIAGVIRILLQK